MSKENTDGNGQREIALTARNSKDDIQDFAEHTMNELLAWYGYGDKVIQDSDHRHHRHHHHHHSKAQNRCHDNDNDNNDDSVRHRSRMSSSASDVTELVPDLVRPETSQTGSEIARRIPASLTSSVQRHREKATKEEFTDPSHSLTTRQRRPGSVCCYDNAEPHAINFKSKSLESDCRLDQQRLDPSTTTTTTTTTMSKLCDWCQQVPPNINFVDFVEGLSQLSFCSELCLNRYKMNLFCTETRQYLQQMQSSEDSSETAVTVSDNRILITPDLWMVEEKKRQCKRRSSKSEDRPEVTTSVVDDNVHCSGESERDDDACHHSDTASNLDVSNGSVTEFGESLERKRNERNSEEGTSLGSDRSSEIGGGDEVKGHVLRSSVDPVAMATGDDGFDFECENVRRGGKRFKKHKVSLHLSYPRSSNSFCKPLEGKPEVISTPSVKDSTTFANVDGSYGSGGKMKDTFESARHDAFHQSQTTTSALSNDLAQFRRLAEIINVGERSKCENPLDSWQGKSSEPLLDPSAVFGSGTPLTTNSLFSVPRLPSLLHLLGPTLSPQFLGSGAPSFPFLGFQPHPSVPGSSEGAGGAGPHIAAGLPAAPPQAANPWSCLLPPSTLMVPYPVLLPIPIPIPIPFPFPVKGGDREEKKTQDGDNEQKKSGTEEMTELRSTESKKIQNLTKILVDKSGLFPNQVIVCSCCRKESSCCSSRSTIQTHDPSQSRTVFCSACPSAADSESRRSSLNDASNSISQTSNDNHILDFSMSKIIKRTDRGSSLRSPGIAFGPTVPSPSPTVSIKSEPLDLAAYSVESNCLPSSSPLVFRGTAATRDLQGFPSLPYLARRNLILDAPSVMKEKIQHVEKNFVDSSTKRFAYCKRRYPNIRVKTK